MVRYLALGPRNEVVYSQHATLAAGLDVAARHLAGAATLAEPEPESGTFYIQYPKMLQAPDEPA
jgi:hypothetical protein